MYIEVNGCWLGSLYFGKFLPLKFFKIYWSEEFTNPLLLLNSHCVKSVQIRSNFSSVFSPNAGKYGPEVTPYMDTFHAVSLEQKNSTVTFQALIWNEGLRYRWREYSHFRYGSLFSTSPGDYHGEFFTIVGLYIVGKCISGNYTLCIYMLSVKMLRCWMLLICQFTYLSVKDSKFIEALILRCLLITCAD